MKTVLLSIGVVLIALAGRLSAEVTITEIDDRIRVVVDDRLFTEWRHKEWAAPFLYPVIGPNGENVTRHYPMRAGVPGEDPDHPHHRSIRFSHSDVNGFNFWWAPGKEKAGHTAEVKLERIEKLASGETGEAIFWNRWLGDGKLVLRERVRLAFTPLEDHQLLMDYDVELHAEDETVLLGDKRDGGLLVRVAGTMKVEDERGNKGAGAIRNSRGDKNTDAWGKRAEWADYFGPDATGQTVGIAMFDHPTNVRFPTHWHARTYGLITANRFGTDHFRGNYEDHKTVVCRPVGDECPACASHSGDYTILAGQSITLRHRLYFHHGDTDAAQVALKYREYAADPASVLILMRGLHQERRWKELVEQFGSVDFSAWPAESANQASEAYHLRGQVHSFLHAGPQAEADLLAAVKLAPQNAVFQLTLADNYSQNQQDDDRALDAYRQSLAISGQNNGWQSLTATISIARLLIDRVEPEAALQTLEPYGDLKQLAPVWRIKMLRTYGHIYAAQGKEAESLAKFRKALELEAAQLK